VEKNRSVMMVKLQDEGTGQKNEKTQTQNRGCFYGRGPRKKAKDRISARGLWFVNGRSGERGKRCAGKKKKKRCQRPGWVKRWPDFNNEISGRWSAGGGRNAMAAGRQFEGGPLPGKGPATSTGGSEGRARKEMGARRG